MAQIFMRFPEGKQRALTFSYDDGVEQDRKLIKILCDNGFKVTVNINSGLYAEEGYVYPEGQIHRRMSASQVKELYTRDGIEVAVHGATHPWLAHLPVAMCTKELLSDRENLEEQFGTIVRGMAYPYGNYDDMVVNCMESVGIVYSRTVNSTHDFDLPSDWMRLNPTCHHDDPQLMELADRFLNDNSGRPRLFYLWGHSYEFEANNNWKVIEDFVNHMKAHQDEMWCATNIEVYDYQKAFEQLQFSVDGNIVHNPTATKLWFTKDWELFSIEPGETKKLK